MSLPHTMRASLEVRPARVLALGKVLSGEGKGLCVCACMHVCSTASRLGSADGFFLYTLHVVIQALGVRGARVRGCHTTY